MPKRFQHAKVLVKAAKRRFAEVNELCKQYVQEQTEDSLEILQERTSEVLYKLRPALDFCATELYVRCNGHKPPPETKVYFPVAQRGAKRGDFKSLACHNIPGLRARPDLVALLESFQEFSDPQNSWLPDLATLTNEGKHDQFSHQDRVEVAGLVFSNVTVYGPGQTTMLSTELLELESGGTVELSAGTELRADGVTIPGPRVIRGDSPHLEPRAPEEELLQKFRYTNVKFTMNNELVQPFLCAAIAGTERIVRDLEARA